MKSISRRSFLKIAGLSTLAVAGSTMLTGCFEEITVTVNVTDKTDLNLFGNDAKSVEKTFKLLGILADIALSNEMTDADFREYLNSFNGLLPDSAKEHLNDVVFTGEGKAEKITVKKDANGNRTINVEIYKKEASDDSGSNDQGDEA